MKTYRHTNSLFFVLFLLAVLSAGAVRASILDQHQEQIGGCWLVISPEWYIAQTFTAGMTGQLEKVDVFLENSFTSHGLYPTTVSVVNVEDSVPSGSVLGSVYRDNLTAGFNSVNFLFQYVFLTVGTQYGIVLFNDDPYPYLGPSTQWCCKDSDVYPAGALWSYTSGVWTQTITPPGGGPDETLYDKDAAFRTYMIPEPATILLLGLGACVLRMRP